MHIFFRNGSLGRVTLPPRVIGIAMTDRGDGTVWAIQNDGIDRIKIVTPLPTGFDGIIYPPFEGPRVPLPFGSAELIVRDGLLGYELHSPYISSTPVFPPDRVKARADLNAVFKIVAPDNMNYGDPLAYETEPF